MKRHPYIIATVIATLLAVVVWLCVPKEYSAVTKVSDEYKEVDLAIGMNSIMARMKEAMGGANTGMNDMEVYCKVLYTEDFARSIAHKQVPGKQMTYGEYLGKKDTIETIQDNIVYHYNTVKATLTIRFSDRDPLVASQMLDSVTAQLQQVVTHNRHYMAEMLLRNALAERDSAKADYQKARDAYDEFIDAHNKISTKTLEQEEQALAQKSNNAYQRYDEAIKQCVRQEALKQRSYLSFAVVENNTVPSSSSPHLIGYLLSFIIIALLLTYGVRLGCTSNRSFIATHISGLFAPWSITILIWGLILGLYYLLDTSLNPITGQFYYCLILWITIFTFCSLATYHLVPSSGNVDNTNSSIPFSLSLFRFFFVLAIVMTPLYVYRILQIVMMFGTDDLMNNIRTLALYGEGQGVLGYSMVITQSLFVVALWAHPRVPTWQVITVGIACLLNSLAIMEKGSIFFVFVSTVFVLYEKGVIKLSSILVFSIILVGFFYLFNLGRAEEDSDYQKEETFLDFFTMYVLSPPVAFCQLTREVIPQFGTNTFETIYLFLDRFGFEGIVVKEKLQEFAWVPIPTNVYTIFQPFYQDFGYKGVAFFAGIYGVVSGWLYRLFRNGNSIGSCLYTYAVYALVLQFYQENIFLSMVFVIQFTFFVVLMTQQKFRFQFNPDRP